MLAICVGLIFLLQERWSEWSMIVHLVSSLLYQISSSLDTSVTNAVFLIVKVGYYYYF